MMNGETSDRDILRHRIKRAELPRVRQKLITDQGNECPLCSRNLKKMIKTPAVDHCHKTGFIRGVLCLNCNGLEGKLTNILRRIDVSKLGEEELLNRFLSYRQVEHTKMIYPSHQTAEEKRTKKNKRARAKYAASKKPTRKRRTK